MKIIMYQLIRGCVRSLAVDVKKCSGVVLSGARFFTALLVLGLFFQQKLAADTFTPELIPQLYDIDWADESGIIKRSFTINIPDSPYAFNPSIIRQYDHYLLAFRHEFPNERVGMPTSHIGLVDLDVNFEPMSDYELLHVGDKIVEDPRILATKQGVFISHTWVREMRGWPVGDIALAKIDEEEKTVSQYASLNYKQGGMEKNWTPFAFEDFQGKEDLYFVYTFRPHKILKLSQPFDGQVSHAFENRQGEEQLQAWEERWGTIRGGTPALKVDDEYLTFFHSSFVFNGVRYYVFGALTFEGSPPFRVTRISESPILFKGMYANLVPPSVWFYPRHHLRVIFPAGFVSGVEDGKEVYYVVCGENDVAIRCVVLDAHNLLKSLVMCR